MKHIHICHSCKIYTMKEECPNCSSRAVFAKPPRFSPTDKLGKYRREAKEEERKQQGKL